MQGLPVNLRTDKNRCRFLRLVEGHIILHRFHPEWQRQVEVAVREELGELQRRLNIDAPLHVESGETARTVCDAAADLETDLLVIGRGSAAGVFGRLRANAYSIIRESRSPVVSV